MTRRQLHRHSVEEVLDVVELEKAGHQFDYTAQLTFPAAHEDVYDVTVNDKGPRMNVEYSIDPVGLFSIPLSRSKYTERSVAEARGRELCRLRNLKLFDIIKCGSTWAIRVYPR